MKKKTITWILIACAAIGGVSYVISGKNKTAATSVKAAQVSIGDIKSYLSTTAVIKSKKSRNYYPLQGKVIKVNVKIGDTVTKGQVLAEFDVSDPGIAVKQAQIGYDNAVLAKQIQVNSNNEVKNNIAALNKQISDIDKQITEDKKTPEGLTNVPSLEAQKSTLQKNRDSLKVPFTSEQLKQSDNNISLQKINLDNAKNIRTKSQSTIVSDIDGVVTALNIVEGSTAAMGTQPAITIQDTNNLKAVMSVGKYDAAKIKLGQEAVIKNGTKEYKGKVSFIEPAATKTVSAAGSDTTLGVEIDITDKCDGLKIDFDTDVDILLGQADNVAKVPAESIRTDKEGKTYAFEIEGNKAVEKEVKLGIQSDMEAQIIEGLSSDNKVILNPSTAMKSGDLVSESTGDK